MIFEVCGVLGPVSVAEFIRSRAAFSETRQHVLYPKQVHFIPHWPINDPNIPNSFAKKRCFILMEAFLADTLNRTYCHHKPLLVIASPWHLKTCQGRGDLRSPQPQRGLATGIASSLRFAELLAMTEGGCIYVMTNNDVDYLITPLIENIDFRK